MKNPCASVLSVRDTQEGLQQQCFSFYTSKDSESSYLPNTLLSRPLLKLKQRIRRPNLHAIPHRKRHIIRPLVKDNIRIGTCPFRDREDMVVVPRLVHVAVLPGDMLARIGHRFPALSLFLLGWIGLGAVGGEGIDLSVNRERRRTIRSGVGCCGRDAPQIKAVARM